MKKINVLLLVLTAFMSCEKDNKFNGTSCFSVENENSIYVDQAVIFTNCPENANFYLWDFGDGNTYTEKSPTHTYSVTGSYSVKLAVQDSEITDLNADLIVNTMDRLTGHSDIFETTITVVDHL